MESNITLRQLFNQLLAEGIHIPQNNTQFVFKAQPPDESPWYVRLFAGIGAWIAAMLLVSFIIAIGFLSQNEWLNLGFGVIICAAAIVLYRSKNDHTFVEQFALSLSILGQIIVTISLGMIFNEIIPAAIGVIVLEIGLITLYNQHFHRFLSYLAIIAATTIICFEIAEMALMPSLTIAIALGLTVIMVNEYTFLASAWWDVIHPARYALVVAGLFIPLHTLVFAEHQWWFVSALILLALVGAVVWLIKRELDVSLGSSWYWVLLVLGLGLAGLSVSVPGVAVALLVLILGFWRNNRVVQGLAIVALFYYIGAYYYTLQTTLLIKSMILMGSGILVLVSRLIATRYNRQEGV